MLRLVANIAGWFIVSIFLTLYNKLSVTTWGMDFPLTIACVHLIMRAPMAAVAMRYLGVRAVHFSWRELCVSYFPVSALIALDIGLSNMAFMFVSVTYYTIVKSSVPMWVLCFSVLLGLQRFSLSLGAVVLCIVVGIALASVDPADETDEVGFGADAVVVGHGLEVVTEHAERVGRRLAQWGAAAAAARGWAQQPTEAHRLLATAASAAASAAAASATGPTWPLSGPLFVGPHQPAESSPHPDRQTDMQQEGTGRKREAQDYARMSSTMARDSAAPPPAPAAPPAAPTLGFSPLGFTLLLVASLCSGLRWALTQILLKRSPPTPSKPPPPRSPSAARLVRVSDGGGGRSGDGGSGEFEGEGEGKGESESKGEGEGKGEGGGAAAARGMHPLALLLVTSPLGTAVLAPLALALEHEQVGRYFLDPQRWAGAGGTVALVAVGGVAAFAMMLFEFRVVQLASGLTLSIAGVFKEVLTILASVVLLGERLTLFNAAGLAVCLAGIGGYQRLRLAEARLAALAAPPDGGDECEPVMGTGAGGGDDGDEAAEERSPSVPTAETRALADAVHTK